MFMKYFQLLRILKRFARLGSLFVLCLILLILNSCSTSPDKDKKDYSALITMADSLLDYAPDSTRNIVAKIISDSSNIREISFNKAMLLYSMCLPIGEQTDSALYWGEQSLILAEHREDTVLIIKSLMNLGNLNTRILNHNKAIACFTRGRLMAENAELAELQIGFLIGMGNVQQNQSDYTSALHSYAQAARLANQHKDINSEAVSYNNIGMLMVAQKDLREAIRYTNMALKHDKEMKNPLNHAMYFQNIGNYYKDLDQADSAMRYYSLAENIYQQVNDSSAMIQLIFNRAIIYANSGKMQQATHDLNLVLNSSRKNHSPEGQMYATNALAEIEYRRANYTQALSYADEALKIARENNILSQLPDIYTKKYEILSALKRYKDAIQALNDSKLISDSLVRISNHSEVSKLKVQFDSELKDREIENLTISLNSKSKAQRLQLYINLFLFLILTGSVWAYFYITRLLRARTAAYNALQTIYSTRQSGPQDENELIIPVFVEENTDPAEALENDKSKRDYQENKIDRRDEKLCHQIKYLLDEKQLFLDAKLTLDKFALRVGADKKTTSVALNQCFGINFPQLINKYRVEYAMKLLSERENDILKVEYIGLKSGFSSRPTFYSIFTSYTGLPPAVYRQGMIDKENKS